jgi:hypothetical protein
MSIFNDKTLKSVAEAASKIMAETSHGTKPEGEKEKKLAALAHPKDKITHKDVLVGRGVLKKEQSGEFDGTWEGGSKQPTGIIVHHHDGKKEQKTKIETFGHLKSHRDALKKADHKVTGVSLVYGKKVDKKHDDTKLSGYEPMLRAAEKRRNMKEETQQLDEISKKTLGNYIKRASKDAAENSHMSAAFVGMSTKADKTDSPAAEWMRGAKEKQDKAEKRLTGIRKATDRLTKEETEQLDEYQSKGGVYRHKGTYGSAKGTEYGDTDYEKENEMQKDADKKKPARKAYGARQNFVRSKRVNESFIDMLEAYTNGGLKGLDDLMYEEVELIEEPDNEQFTKELEDQKASMEGKKKQPSVAAASTQGVKTMPEEVEQLKEDPLAFRSLYSTDPAKHRLLKTQKGREAAAKRNVPELKDKIKNTLARGQHVKPNLPEQFEDDFDLDEAAMSHQAKTTMKHIKNPTSGEKQAAKDIKPGIAGYRDRISMLKSAEARGALNKEEVKVTQLPPGPEPKGKWGKGLSRPRFQKGDGPQKTRNTGDDNYTDQRMRDAENRGTLDNREHGRRLRGEEVEQLDEVGDTPAGKEALRAVQKRSADKMTAWSKNPQSGYSSTPKDVNKAVSSRVRAGRRLQGFGPQMKNEEVEQLEERSDRDEPYDHGEDPLKNRQEYAKMHRKPGMVYKKTYPGDKVGMSKSYAYDISRTGPKKGKLPEEVDHLEEATRVIAKHGDVEVHAHRGDDEGYMVDVRKNGKKVAEGDHDRYAGTTFISHPSFGKGQKGFRSHEELAKHFSTMKEHIDLDERTLTEPEAKKKEEYVKGMKKKLSGFKQRYGERAKEVMYATATRMAKKED